MVQLTQFVRRAAQINGRGTATRFDGRHRTWEEFRTRVRRLAAGLLALGLEPRDRVAILALNSDRYLESFFALAWAGLSFVPINTRLALPEMAFWLQDSGCRALLYDASQLPAATQLRQLVPDIRHAVRIDAAQGGDGISYECLIEHSAPHAGEGGGGDDLAGIFYTGGTTGRSKGVMLSHANLVFHAMNVVSELGFTHTTNWLHAGPMFHLSDGAATFAVTAACGAHSFIPRFDPVAYLEAVAREAVTDSVCIPTMLNMLINHPDFGRYDLSTLRGILYGGAPMPLPLLARAVMALPRVRFTQAYGQSEAAPILTLLTPEFHGLTGAAAAKMASGGRTVVGCEIKIVDEHDCELPPGKVGEICGRGPNVMLGYWNLPEQTAAALRSGWLHTGDAGMLDEDGFVYVVGRMKDMIISGGENIYAAEVEAALYQHSAVQECAVIAVPDDFWGERVHAIVRLKLGCAASEQELQAHCRALIAGYKCPRSFEFRMEPMPLSGAGKIQKAELRAPHWQGRERQVS
jgi:acyl-CoA synthetase (AMP-forming)/AMP-acid ligase II